MGKHVFCSPENYFSSSSIRKMRNTNFDHMPKATDLLLARVDTQIVATQRQCSKQSSTIAGAKVQHSAARRGIAVDDGSRSSRTKVRNANGIGKGAQHPAQRCSASTITIRPNSHGFGDSSVQTIWEAECFIGRDISCTPDVPHLGMKIVGEPKACTG